MLRTELLCLNADDVSIEYFIKKQLKNYDNDYITHLVDTGGYCNFLLGIFPGENVMFEFSNEIISMLSASKVSMRFDFYDGEE